MTLFGTYCLVKDQGREAGRPSQGLSALALSPIPLTSWLSRSRPRPAPRSPQPQRAASEGPEGPGCGDFELDPIAHRGVLPIRSGDGHGFLYLNSDPRLAKIAKSRARAGKGAGVGRLHHPSSAPESPGVWSWKENTKTEERTRGSCGPSQLRASGPHSGRSVLPLEGQKVALGVTGCAGVGAVLGGVVMETTGSARRFCPGCK